jgi:DNA-binding response OmpR family regulator/curved DNA-binding protein CbpA
MTARLLLAEDNLNLAQMLQKFLAAQGFAVQTTPDGIEALRIASSADLDLLLLDLKLPGLNGIQILQKLRSTPQGAKLPVIIISGVFKGENYAAEARKLGVTHYLDKPFTPQALLAAITATLQGSAAPASFPMRERILDIHNRALSGTLSLGKGSPIAFIKGEPCSFSAHGQEDFFAFLVERGKIGLDDLRKIVASREERLFLTQTGLLTYQELYAESQQFLAKQLSQALQQSTPGEFREGMPEIELPLVSLSLQHLLYEASQGTSPHLDAKAFASKFNSLFPARTELFFRRANITNLREADIALLQRVNGQTPYSAVIAGSANPQGAAAFFDFLLSLGMLTFRQAPAAEAVPPFQVRNLYNRPIEEAQSADETSIGFEDLVEEISDSLELVSEGPATAPLSSDEINFEQTVLRDHAFLKGKNYYELFGVSRNTFSFDAIKAAYFAKSHQYTPDKFMMLSGSTQEMAQEILSTFATAYNTLSNVVSKERYDEVLNSDKVGLDGQQDGRLQARVQLQSGKVFLEMHEFENAQKALQDAFTLNPQSAEACAFLGWSIYRNPANSGSRAAKEKARTLLSKSLQLKNNADAYAFRGCMLFDEGRDELAEGEFQKALKLNPKELNARKGLRLITEKRENENKGIFKKFFG